MKKTLSIVTALLICALVVSCATAQTEIAPAAVEEAPISPITNLTTGKNYDTIEAAFAELEEGDEIVLNADVASPFSIFVNKSFTLDLNGFTFSGAYLENGVNDGSINIEGTAAEPVKNVVIKNGTLAGAYAGSKRSGGTIRASHVDNLLVENVKLISKADNTALQFSFALYALYTNAVVDNCDIQGAILFYWNPDKGPQTVVTLKNSEIVNDDTSAYTGIINCGSECIINFDNVKVASGIIENSGGILSIGAGTYCFDPAKYVDASAFNIANENGSYIVTAK